MNRRAGAVLGLIAIAVLGACEDNPVGRLCDLGNATPGPADRVVSSPSLDCVSRTCLRVPPTRPLPPGSTRLSGNNGLCTAECTQDDECDRVPESPCVTGFTCAVAVDAGPFCCKKFCVCKDYILVVPTPATCDATDSRNACCNLPGRTDNPAYELCRS
jgi:hypothetical protein